MPTRLGTLDEARALGIPDTEWVISIGSRRASAKSLPNATPNTPPGPTKLSTPPQPDEPAGQVGSPNLANQNPVEQLPGGGATAARGGRCGWQRS